MTNDVTDLVSVRYMVDDVDDAIAFYTANPSNPVELFQPAAG
jgi:hypothetical protein